MSEVKAARMSREAFHSFMGQLHGTHPRTWKIDWESLPKTIELSAQGLPVYYKTGRTNVPECLLDYKENNLVARRWITGYWETFHYGLDGHLSAYDNSLGAWYRQYWQRPYDVHPFEKHTGKHRWILIHSCGVHALYWCAFTGLYRDGERIIPRQDLEIYFDQWGKWDEEKDEVWEKAAAMPFSNLMRRLWLYLHPAPV
jgi:hypothetical protein